MFGTALNLNLFCVVTCAPDGRILTGPDELMGRFESGGIFEDAAAAETARTAQQNGVVCMLPPGTTSPYQFRVMTLAEYQQATDHDVGWWARMM